MSKHTVISAFRDKFSGERFSIGGIYESNDSERINFLQENKFLSKESIESEPIVEIEIEHVGGGYYKLPNGEKIKGKKKAHQKWGEMNA